MITEEQLIEKMSQLPDGTVCTVPSVMGSEWKDFGTVGERGQFGKKIRRLMDDRQDTRISYKGKIRGEYGKIACYVINNK